MSARLSATLIAGFVACLAPPTLADAPRIVIDGHFDDWAGPIPAAEDPFDASDAELDLTRIAITHDREAVYVQLEFADQVLLQGLTGTATLLFDADGDEETGKGQLGVPGVDAAIVFSPPAPGWTTGARGIIARSVGTPGSAPGESLTSYDLGVMVAPTYAANVFEIRIDRGVTLPGTGELFRAADFSVGFALVGPDSSVDERSDVLTYAFGPVTSDSSKVLGSRDPLARAEGTDLRVLSWNVSGRSILDNAETFRRILAALAPDIMLFDEAPAIPADTLLGAFASLPSPTRSWNAVVGPGGGRQHAVVMSHHPVSLAGPLARIAYPESFPAFLASSEPPWTGEDLNASGVSAAGVIVDVGERRLLAVPLDLECCGRVGDPEEPIREIQATAIHEAVTAALPSLDVDGVIIAGDFNLVTQRRPLDLLRVGLDVDGSDLAVLEAIQLDGRSAATWGLTGVFSPSRLDYFLYADSELMPVNAFVFDPRDLAEEWLEAHDLQPDDVRVSGHHPIVADLRWAHPVRQD